MTFEILSHNLYELIKLNKFMPLSSELIRRISIQVLSTLLFLYKHDIVHCDIKP
jgi:serine/threonine protein kinase